MLWKKMTHSPKIGKLSKEAMPPDLQSAINDRQGRAVNFLFAIYYLKQGGKLMRISWDEQNSYIFMKDGILFHNKPYHKEQIKINEVGYPYVMCEEDIYAEDWIVI